MTQEEKVALCKELVERFIACPILHGSYGLGMARADVSNTLREVFGSDVLDEALRTRAHEDDSAC